jgi:hypothetical protein
LIPPDLARKSPVLEWFERAWKQLMRDIEDDGEEQRFWPENERHIQAHLYHHLLATKRGGIFRNHRVIAEYRPLTRKTARKAKRKTSNQKKRKRRYFDLAIMDGNQLKLPIEIKETGSPIPVRRMKKRKDFVEKRIAKDAGRLRRLANRYKVPAVLIFMYRVDLTTTRWKNKKGELSDWEEHLSALERSWYGKGVILIHATARK